MVKVLDSGFEVIQFELQSHYYFHFRINTLGKGMNSLIIPTMGYVGLLLFFQNKVFSLKWSTEVDMPLKIKKPRKIKFKIILFTFSQGYFYRGRN